MRDQILVKLADRVFRVAPPIYFKDNSAVNLYVDMSGPCGVVTDDGNALARLHHSMGLHEGRCLEALLAGIARVNGGNFIGGCLVFEAKISTAKSVTMAYANCCKAMRQVTNCEAAGSLSGRLV